MAVNHKGQIITIAVKYVDTLQEKETQLFKKPLQSFMLTEADLQKYRNG